MSKIAVQRRHNALEDDIVAGSGRLRTKSITGKRKSRSEDDSSLNQYIDARSSRKILAIAQSLAEEDAASDRAKAKAVQSNAAFDFASRFENEADEESGGREWLNGQDDEDNWLPEETVTLDDDVDPADMATFAKFLQQGEELADFAPSLSKLTTGQAVDDREAFGAGGAGDRSGEDGGETTNLADLILQRIAEKEAREAAEGGGDPDFDAFEPPEGAVEIPVKVMETFTKVGQLLSRYKSGPVPKPFKVLPTLPQWPELLEISQPQNWSPQAVYRATKIFISAPQATGQHFCSTVLLDAVRADIQENRKLNHHLYEALMAAFYRPAAFFKGFLFPLVQSSCTLREAQIVSSVLTKHKIPVLHSAAAILRLCEICAEQTSSINSEAAGAANILIRALLAKKYALPYKVVDALVFHFLRFRSTKEKREGDEQALAANEAKLPVLWHQTFLIFAQTYRNEITEDQREMLLDLLLARGHKDIGPQVRRELLAGRNRGQEAAQAGEARDDGDDTMDIS
ncbi:hypothetical protein DV735_g2081, partial [Chaetothyriales sp. CBS 134920]